MKTIKTLFTILLLLAGSSMLAQTNLALSGTVTVSSEEHAGTLGTYANDDNMSTRWSSAHLNDDQWLVLKLDQSYDISDVSIKWQNANAEAYALEISSDSTNWTRVDSISGKSNGDRTDDIIVDANAQYIRVVCYNRSTAWGYSIYEIEVSETISDAQNATLSDLLVDGTTIDNFDSEDTTYTYIVSSSTVPTTTATASATGATIDITDAITIPGTTTVKVTSSGGIVKTYSIEYVETLASEYCQRRVAHNNHDAETGGDGPVFLTISNISDTTIYVQIDPVDTSSVDYFGVEGLSGFTKVSRDTINGVSIKEIWKNTDAPSVISIQVLWSTTAFGGNRMLSTFEVPFAATCDTDPGVPTISAPITEDVKFKIYPNPVSDQLYISSEIPAIQVNIYSLSGQLVKTVTPQGASVNVSDLESGIYLSKISFDDGSENAQHIIKL